MQGGQAGGSKPRSTTMLSLLPVVAALLPAGASLAKEPPGIGQTQLQPCYGCLSGSAYGKT